MPSPGSTELTPPTENGARIRDYVLAKAGSIAAAARAAGVSEKALRRRIYGRYALENTRVAARLEAYGIPREWLHVAT